MSASGHTARVIIGSALVFLDLLEGDADPFAELGMAQRRERATDAQALPHIEASTRCAAPLRRRMNTPQAAPLGSHVPGQRQHNAL